jgi:hypothetical protein
MRHGENYRDSLGHLVNVGGDFQQPHRSIDPLDRTFMAGHLARTARLAFLATYEVRNQIWIDGWCEAERVTRTFPDIIEENRTFGVRLRMEF